MANTPSIPPRRNKYDVVKSEFVVSNTDVSRCPSDGLPEYAFIGRSNVGKSSLINMLCGRKNLALTSSRPGKTMLINHFLINGSWYMVDLPGYGYAKRSKGDVGKLAEMIDQYVARRDELTCLFVLVDSRVPPQDIDLRFVNRMGEMGVPIAIVFTKVDSPNGAGAGKNMQDFKRRLSETWEELPPTFVTSSARKHGRDELLKYIRGINVSLANSKK